MCRHGFARDREVRSREGHGSSRAAKLGLGKGDDFSRAAETRRRRGFSRCGLLLRLRTIQKLRVPRHLDSFQLALSRFLGIVLELRQLSH